MAFDVGRDFQTRWLAVPEAVRQQVFSELHSICTLLEPETHFEEWKVVDARRDQVHQALVKTALEEQEARRQAELERQRIEQLAREKAEEEERQRLAKIAEEERIERERLEAIEAARIAELERIEAERLAKELEEKALMEQLEAEQRALEAKREAERQAAIAQKRREREEFRNYLATQAEQQINANLQTLKVELKEWIDAQVKKEFGEDDEV